ncbi:hypothetical protein [Plectonema radiosum]|nr:hypothetical protein [Plectonema radiosum]
MKGKRVTLAIRGVRWLDTSVAIITYLLAEQKGTSSEGETTLS